VLFMNASKQFESSSATSKEHRSPLLATLTRTYERMSGCSELRESRTRQYPGARYRLSVLAKSTPTLLTIRNAVDRYTHRLSQ